ncbi:MAG: hypothetical protein ACQESU_09010, partial [Halobacteriota archaeon]
KTDSSLYFSVTYSLAPKRSDSRTFAASVSIWPENHGTYAGFFPDQPDYFLSGSGSLTTNSESDISPE